MSKTIGLIPIRSGSKSIPGKNIKDFYGKPLVYWVTKALSNSEEFDEVHVAVDCEEYANIVRNFELPKVEIFYRHPDTAKDDSQSEEVMLDFIYRNNYDGDDLLALVQATSPFTTSEEFSDAIRQLRESDCDSMLSAVVFKRFLWEWDGAPINYDYMNRPLRQQWDGSALENGSFYVNSIRNIERTRCRLSGKVLVYSLPEFHLYEIDEESDYVVMEKIFERNVLNKK